ncbi:MAG: IS630 family transposase, partial [Candidatus Parabeggiatoa sp.]|nr:IS630 family transposase [Candidatus Parabeggiatoa sp.]
DRFKVSTNFLADLLKRVKQTGQVTPKPHGGGHPPSVKTQGETFLKDLIESQPDLILEEIRDEYNEHFKPVSRSTIDRTLTRLKLTRKKKTLFDPIKNSLENKQKKQDYQTNIAPFEAKDFIFIDETGSVRNLTRSHARSPKGQRAHSENSLIRGTRISTIGALNIDGILTALCYEGTLTALLFAFFVKEFLVPVLSPSNVVILDNATSHYSEEAIAMIEETGAGVVFLPPYSPELNPIEHIWAKVKSFLKKTVISNTNELYQAIADALKTITPDQAKKSIQHCL